MPAQLILASASPRRKELLEQLGWDFIQANADIDETPKLNERAEDLVKRLAEAKAMFVYNQSKGQLPSLGSDTVVVSQGEIFGKPLDFEDSKRMLNLLKNSVHQVMTAISLVTKGQAHTQIIITEVHVTDISEQQIIDYWQSGEPQDKAGSYAIQGIGGKFIQKINGSYSSVVGLPLVETQAMLCRHI